VDVVSVGAGTSGVSGTVGLSAVVSWGGAGASVDVGAASVGSAGTSVMGSNVSWMVMRAVMCPKLRTVSSRLVVLAAK